MMGRKQAATSAPPISTLDLDGYARNPGGPVDSIHATDLAAAGRRRSTVGARDVAEARPDRAEDAAAGRSSLSASSDSRRHPPKRR